MPIPVPAPDLECVAARQPYAELRPGLGSCQPVRHVPAGCGLDGQDARDPPADGHNVDKAEQVPLAADRSDEALGNIYLTEKANGADFTPEDESLLVLFAAQAAMAWGAFGLALMVAPGRRSA